MAPLHYCAALLQLKHSSSNIINSNQIRHPPRPRYLDINKIPIINHSYHKLLYATVWPSFYCPQKEKRKIAQIADEPEWELDFDA